MAVAWSMLGLIRRSLGRAKATQVGAYRFNGTLAAAAHEQLNYAQRRRGPRP
jgi:hypothetical protein